MTNDYLIQKKPFYALVIFSLPIIIGNLFQQTYTMADSAIAGRFVGGTSAGSNWSVLFSDQYFHLHRHRWRNWSVCHHQPVFRSQTLRKDESSNLYSPEYLSHNQCFT